MSLPLPASPQPPRHPTIPPLSLLTGPTVTTLGSYEVSEGCERKKGQRWGSLERRGMQAMEGEFSHKGFSPSPSPNFPSSLSPPRTLSQDTHLPPSSAQQPLALLRAQALREVQGTSFWGFNHQLTRLCVPRELPDRKRPLWTEL